MRKGVCTVHVCLGASRGERPVCAKRSDLAAHLPQAALTLRECSVFVLSCSRQLEFYFVAMPPRITIGCVPADFLRRFPPVRTRRIILDESIVSFFIWLVPCVSVSFSFHCRFTVYSSRDSIASSRSRRRRAQKSRGDHDAGLTVLIDCSTTLAKFVD